MALPEQVRKQIEEADKLFKSQHTDVNAELEANNDPSIVDVIPDPNLDTDAGQDGDGKQTTGTDTGAEPQNTDAALADLQREIESMREELAVSKHRYLTLQGMFEKANEELSQTRGLLAVLQSQPAKPQISPGTETLQIEVTDKEREEYGDDLIQLIISKATQAARGMMLETRSEVDRLRNSVESNNRTVETVAESAFMTQLTSVAPTWRELNEDRGFLAWLSQVDGLSGHTRHEYLHDAFASRDLARTAQFFNVYQESLDAAKARANAEAAADDANGGVTRPSKEDVVSPGRSKADANTAQSGKVWSGADIRKFYADVQAGRIKGKDKYALEADIFKAQREGRIRP